jgi:hypothetical protein
MALYLGLFKTCRGVAVPRSFGNLAGTSATLLKKSSEVAVTLGNHSISVAPLLFGPP